MDIKSKVKSEKQDWYQETFKPTHYLTIQLPEHQKTKDEFKSLSHLRMIMKVFEKSLLGRHWNKKHLPFIAFAENNTSPEWHYNILFNQGGLVMTT